MRTYRVDRHAEALGRSGHEVTVICAKSPETASKEKRMNYSIERFSDLLSKHSEKTEIDDLEKKMQKLLEGGYLGSPRRRLNF
jgi:alkanesulfonate monooxygenase SsuD/methylene tetrahydromethanopterin reductase-like flavin-dependent oxidoreductase (luciferase family)